MLKRFGIPLLLAAALTAPAAGQIIAQPNRAADISAVPPEDQHLTHLAQQLAGRPTTQPAATAASLTARAASPVAVVAPTAPPLDPKEKLPLGGAKASSSGKMETGVPPVTETGAPWLLSTVAALGVVVGLILVLRAVISKLSGRAVASSQSPVIEVLSRTNVAPRNQVMLLRLGRRVLVVGDSPAGLRTLANIEDPEEVASLLQAVTAAKPGSVTSGFAHLLDRFDAPYDDAHTGGDQSEHHVDRAREGVRGLLARVRRNAKGGEA